jgi:hypothetical protein
MAGESGAKVGRKESNGVGDTPGMRMLTTREDKKMA